MIPPWDLIRVKNMLNSTVSMSFPDVVIACIEHECLWKHSQSKVWGSVGEHDNSSNYSLVVELEVL